MNGAGFVDFGFYLPCYWPDTGYPARDMYRDAVAQAICAEQAGYVSLSIPEHHFINYLVHPQPLLTAVKVAAVTERIPLITAVLVLPFYDIRRLAGEVAQADNLTDGRLQIGVGRGAFRYEFDRFGVPEAESLERFIDSLQLLEALLTREEVSWKSKYYDFGPLTVTPRPLQIPHPPIWIAALAAHSISDAARRGYHVQTTPLRDPFGAAKMQADSFFDAVAEMGPGARHQRLSMLRMAYVSRSQADIENKVRIAFANHQRFHNVRETPGTVSGGAITPLEVDITPDDIRDALVIGSSAEVIDKLERYASLGIHDIQLNMSFGAEHGDVMASLELFAAEVLPHLRGKANSARARRFRAAGWAEAEVAAE